MSAVALIASQFEMALTCTHARTWGLACGPLTVAGKGLPTFDPRLIVSHSRKYVLFGILCERTTVVNYEENYTVKKKYKLKPTRTKVSEPPPSPQSVNFQTLKNEVVCPSASHLEPGICAHLSLQSRSGSA